MKKIIIIAAAVTSLATAANAQSNASGTAQQNVQLGLSDALEMTFTGNSSTTGATVALPFTTTDDYANGVQSSAQQLKVRSNKTFNVTVKANASNFSVTNNGTTTTSTMPAATLEVKVAANGTGGSIAGTFAGFTSLSTTAANLISNGNNGGNQTFSVMYNSAPGFSYPAGTYNMDVVYTATQQ